MVHRLGARLHCGMPQRLPRDVVKFLLDNPSELTHIQQTMRARALQEQWRKELEEKRKHAKIVPCGTYGCTNPRSEYDIMCASCLEDYKEDPDAYK